MDVELELRAVEGALALGDLVLQVGGHERVGECLFPGVPELVGADALLGARGELDVDALELERGVHLVEELQEARDLRLHVGL